jgi:hypothetical protein
MRKYRDVMFLFLLSVVGVVVGKTYADPCLEDHKCTTDVVCSGWVGGCNLHTGKKGVCYETADGTTMCCYRTKWPKTKCTGVTAAFKYCELLYSPCETMPK